MASLAQIAERVGVSKTSVSIYMKDPSTSRLAQETKDKIEAAIKELNYRPNVIARGLSNRRTRIIGVMIPYNGPLFHSSFVNEVLSGIQTELFKNGYSMIFLPTKGEDSPSMVKNQLEVAHGYDGLLLFGTRYCTLEHLRHNVDQLLQSNIPFAAVNMPELDRDINQVILQTPEESDPVDYLIRCGHQKILLVVGRDNDPESCITVDKYKQTLAQHDLPFRPEYVLHGDFEREIARSETLNAMRSGIPFSAAYSLSDTMAIGIYEAVKSLKLSVPEDVSVIGSNDAFFARTMDPPLTTVRKQLFSTGVEASRSLLRTIETGKTGRKVWLNNELILRSSTKINMNPNE